MAYGKRYTIAFSSEDGTSSFLIELHQDGYTYDPEPALVAADRPCIISSGPDTSLDDPNWTIALARAEIQVIDRAGRLSSLAGIDQQEVKGFIYVNDTLIFEGFVVPGQYVYDRYLSSVAQISLVSGESFLGSRLYRDNVTGSNYTGLVSPVEVLRNCLAIAGKTGYIVSGMYWLPRLTNNLTSAMDPLRRLRIDQGEFVDADGNPITCLDVLRIILTQYQLQLGADANNWQVLQRRRVVDTVNNEFEVFVHTGLLSQVALDLPYALDIWDDDRTTLEGYSIGHTRPYKYAGAIYNHLGPEAGVLRFGGFEQSGFTDADILKTALSPPGTTDVWIVSADMDGITIAPPGAKYTIETGPRAGAVATSAKSLSIPAEYAAAAYDYTDEADNGDMEDLRDEFATHPYAFQLTSGFIQGGTDVSLIVRANVSMQWKSTVAQTTEVFFCMRVKIGDYWVVPNIPKDGTYTFTETPTDNLHYLVFRVERIGFEWVTLSIETDVLDDAGTPITGPMYIELLAGVEAQNPIGQLSTNSRWDDIIFEVIDADGNPENQATQSTSVYSTSKNTYGPDAAVLMFGDGPTEGHKRRQRIQDGAGAVVDVPVPGNWQIGRTFTGDDSGKSHLQLWAEELVRQHQYPLLRADLVLQLHDDLLSAYSFGSVLRDTRRLQLAEDRSVGSGFLTVTPDGSIDPELYGVIQTRRDITIGSETYRVLFAVLTDEEDDVWTLYLDGVTTQNYLAGSAVTQVIDYTVNRWEYDCRKNRLSLSAIEILAGDDPDVTCTYDVAPGSIQASTLPDLAGVPCADEITPVAVFDPVVFMGLSNNGETDNTQAGIYSTDVNFDMASFQLRLATASRPRVIVPLNSRRQLLFNLEDEREKIYIVDLATFDTPTVWLDVSPDDVHGFAVNEMDEEVLVTIDDSVTASADTFNIYDYDGTLLRGAGTDPADHASGCPGIDSHNRIAYVRHNPGVRAVTAWDLDSMAYLNAEATYVYGGMGPIEYNSVNNQLYWHENAAGNTKIYRKQPSGGGGGDVELFTCSAFSQMYYSKTHGELLVGNGVGVRLPPMGVEEIGTSILAGLDENPLCRGICVYEPGGGHTA